MKVATWNVNSVRTRLAHVTDWLQTSQVDVLCMQETKVQDDSFPRQAFEDLGYNLAISGQKSYNGVAIASKHPIENITIGFSPLLSESISQWDEQKRVISAVVNGVQIVNLYVPNGSSVGSEKYIYKLGWFSVLETYLQTLFSQSPDLLVCGDFNVAPEDIDIYDPTGREKEVMATDAERLALQTAIAKLGLSDIFRKFNQAEGQFSWWDYRTGAFRRNAGWRIDHIYLSPSLTSRAIACAIDIEPRKLEKPSDHTPVIVELAAA
ncbi:MAG TPA: exodeoxyribonuclease III [Leptolyngbyaceae cyanobacterium M33_DOE_097]|uniref:Exodeoxyribonuclease III n=1 Tax=Oscillatoriales cyanobacterium SpSt-418 TaxID=2282169 RepID=A0A7C3PPG9_9CYAN|nr:exodeoxyribonuclease III [Leptolyngbyaceae cyanobacterium M33_DOE_097]